MGIKRIMICFDEHEVLTYEGGPRFDVHLEGITPERMKEIQALKPEEQMYNLTTAEFWALRSFQMVAQLMKDSGSFVEAKKKSG